MADHLTPEQKGMHTGKTDRGVSEREAHDARPSNHVLDYLRQRGAEMDVLPTGQRVTSLETQAADEIERLTLALRVSDCSNPYGCRRQVSFDEHIERLTAERDEARKFMHINADAVDALQAERDRLRAALEAMYALGERGKTPSDVQYARALASEALAGAADEPEADLCQCGQPLFITKWCAVCDKTDEPI